MSALRARQIIQNQRGQLVIEYVLMLVVMVALASIIFTKLVGSGGSGLIYNVWGQVQTSIASDDPDSVQ